MTLEQYDQIVAFAGRFAYLPQKCWPKVMVDEKFVEPEIDESQDPPRVYMNAADYYGFRQRAWYDYALHLICVDQ